MGHLYHGYVSHNQRASSFSMAIHGDPPGPPHSQRSASGGTLEETPGTAEVKGGAPLRAGKSRERLNGEKWYPLVI